jgi:Zn-dependent peptidase ImmA (M78 family)
MEQLLEEFAKRKIKVVFQELQFWSGLLLFSNTKQRWICIVNLLNEVPAQRWTLAHELAHFLLHPDSRRVFTDGIFFCGLNDLEWQANRMAAEMLMPQKDLQDMTQVGRESASAVSEILHRKAESLRVPPHILAWWLFENGYLPRSIYNKARQE